MDINRWYSFVTARNDVMLRSPDGVLLKSDNGVCFQSCLGSSHISSSSLLKV
jgi:hypothetical protein